MLVPEDGNIFLSFAFFRRSLVSLEWRDNGESSPTGILAETAPICAVALSTTFYLVDLRYRHGSLTASAFALRFSLNLLSRHAVALGIIPDLRNAMNRILGNLPGLAEFGGDGVTTQIVVDALGEKAFGRGLAERSEDSFGAFLG